MDETFENVCIAYLNYTEQIPDENLTYQDIPSLIEDLRMEMLYHIYDVDLLERYTNQLNRLIKELGRN